MVRDAPRSTPIDTGIYVNRREDIANPIPSLTHDSTTVGHVAASLSAAHIYAIKNKRRCCVW